MYSKLYDLLFSLTCMHLVDICIHAFPGNQTHDFASTILCLNLF